MVVISYMRRGLDVIPVCFEVPVFTNHIDEVKSVLALGDVFFLRVENLTEAQFEAKVILYTKGKIGE